MPQIKIPKMMVNVGLKLIRKSIKSKAAFDIRYGFSFFLSLSTYISLYVTILFSSANALLLANWSRSGMYLPASYQRCLHTQKMMTSSSRTTQN